ncbi:hypothetical protein J3458_021798 [Metarhizium acridum]|uniref:uncharacterized protein n=1 Tax=Metarhizium acridum TaxID=92637 RepID=UPI001C6C586B|nr:hypothetical protein J3458_021798 [Metarhizium acridum]
MRPMTYVGTNIGDVGGFEAESRECLGIGQNVSNTVAEVFSFLFSSFIWGESKSTTVLVSRESMSRIKGGVSEDYTKTHRPGHHFLRATIVFMYKERRISNML